MGLFRRKATPPAPKTEHQIMAELLSQELAANTESTGKLVKQLREQAEAWRESHA